MEIYQQNKKYEIKYLFNATINCDFLFTTAVELMADSLKFCSQHYMHSSENIRGWLAIGLRSSSYSLR
jgi:hypothetical protein